MRARLQGPVREDFQRGHSSLGERESARWKGWGEGGSQREAPSWWSCRGPKARVWCITEMLCSLVEAKWKECVKRWDRWVLRARYAVLELSFIWRALRSHQRISDQEDLRPLRVVGDRQDLRVGCAAAGWQRLVVSSRDEKWNSVSRAKDRRSVKPRTHVGVRERDFIQDTGWGC